MCLVCRGLTNMTNKPLSNIFVVAIEQAVAAPLCTVRLADAGARVIKIERPEGETARNYDSAVKGTSAYFAWLNRGKESAVLNLKDSADLDVLHNMLEKADILVQNLVPGALDRMGLTAEVITEKYPHLIAVSILGYGQDTPYAKMRAYDMLVQAESGLCAVTGTPESPSKIGVSVADIGTGMNAHAAILEALIARQNTGLGQIIEVSMFDGMADWISVPFLHFEHTGRETARYGLSHASVYPYGPAHCVDGSVIIAVQNNNEWQRLCEGVLMRPDLFKRTEFETNAARVQNRDLLDAEIEPIFAKMYVNELINRLEVAGVAFGRYTELRNLGDHPALRRTEVTLPDGQVITMPRPAGRQSDFKTGPIPATGEQTDAVRREFGQE